MRAKKARANRIVGVVSGKGGVGKSFLSVNITTLLKRMGKNPLIVDCDLSNPSVGLHLGLSYGNVGIQEVLMGKNKIGEAVVVQPQTGVRILPASLKYRPGIGLKKLKKLLQGMDEYDYIVIDAPPGITEDVEHIIDACDDLIIVTTPDIPSVTSAAKMADLCKDVGKKVTGILVNRVTDSAYELQNKEIEGMTEIPVLANVPEDRNVPESIAARTPIVLYNPSSPAATRIYAAVVTLTGIAIHPTIHAGIFGRINAFLRRLAGRRPAIPR
ncbi:MAG: P-loop NTPase [Candidatus Micrarchaeota archaeon]